MCRTCSSLLRVVLLVTLGLASCSTSPNELVIQISRGDDEGKSDAIVKLGELFAEKEAAGFPFSEGDLEALGLLKDVAATDSEPRHRMLAISALRGLDHFDHTDVYLQGLESKFWGVRLESAKAFVAHPDSRALSKIVERVRVEPSKVVLVDLVKALAKHDDREALGALLAMFLDVTGRYDDHHLKIYDSMRRLSGKTWPITERSRWRELLESENASDAPATTTPAPSGGGP